MKFVVMQATTVEVPETSLGEFLALNTRPAEELENKVINAANRARAGFNPRDREVIVLELHESMVIPV